MDAGQIEREMLRYARYCEASRSLFERTRMETNEIVTRYQRRPLPPSSAPPWHVLARGQLNNHRDSDSERPRKMMKPALKWKR